MNIIPIIWEIENSQFKGQFDPLKKTTIFTSSCFYGHSLDELKSSVFSYLNGLKDCIIFLIQKEDYEKMYETSLKIEDHFKNLTITPLDSKTSELLFQLVILNKQFSTLSKPISEVFFLNSKGFWEDTSNLETEVELPLLEGLSEHQGIINLLSKLNICNIQISLICAVFLTNFCDTIERSNMFSFFIKRALVEEKISINEKFVLDLEILCKKIIPLGVPSESFLTKFWELQKVQLKESSSNNYLDCYYPYLP